MAYDLILKPNTLNLSQVSGPGPYGPAQGPAQRPSQRPGRDHGTAYPQLQAFTKRLNTFNRTLSAWYAQNTTNPAARKLANTFTTFRNKAYGYIKAYTPGLSTRFLKETPPKELELQAFYKRFLAVSGIAPGQSTAPLLAKAASVSTPAPAPGLPAFGIRTAKAKARSASPKTSSLPTQPEASPPSPPVSLPEGMNKGLLIAGSLAALGGIFLVARNSSSAPAPRTPTYRPARTTRQIYSAKQF